MKNLIKNVLFGRPWSQAFFRRVLGISLEGLGMIGAGRGARTSGEAWAIRYALSKSSGVPIVFDVGAQGGDYTQVVLETSPESRVYAFEPAQQAFQNLQSLAKNPQVTLLKLALGAKDATAPLYSAEGVGGVDSLYHLPDTAHNHYSVIEHVEVRSVDSFCKERSITHIDLLKFDVEGGEFEAIKGAHEMIEKDAISFIQFEHSGTSFYAGYRFKDIFDFLSLRYRIYRILRNGLAEIPSAGPFQEFPFAVNYLAELKK